MKNLSRIIPTFMVIGMFMQSCAKNEPEIPVPDNKTEVEFSLDYSFPSSGNMGRSTNDDIYTEFYESYILTKKVTPSGYSLTFTDKEGGVTQATFNGNWEKPDLVRLPAGKYHVTGSSVANFTTASLVFEQDVEISKTTTSITLDAIYNCSLLLFNYDTENPKKEMSVNSYTTPVPKTDKVYYIFLNETYYKSTISWYEYSNRSASINLSKFTFENGKYYFFNDVTGGFNIPPMTNGDEL